MDKVSKTPRTNEARISAWGEGGIEVGIGLSVVPVEFCRELERELAAAQAEIERLKKRKDECCNGWGAALKDAVENMDIANEFKRLMEQYRQRADEAYKQSHIDAERYRWLREKIESQDLTIATADSWSLKSWCGDNSDAAIDAAMKEPK